MKQFRASIWAKEGEFGVCPISSIEEAQILLDGWPTTGRSPTYYFAANSMKSAREGAITPDEAAPALIKFLDEMGALAEEKLQN